VPVSNGQVADGMESLAKPLTIDQLVDRIETTLVR
jgi:hypothetical protein